MAPAPCPDAGGAVWDRLTLGLLAALLLLVAATFRDYGLSWDEPFHIEYGERLLKYYASGGADESAFDYINLYLYGGLFDAPVALLAQWLPFGLIDNRHLLIALTGLLGIAGAWRLARQLAGPRAGFAAALLLATMPGWYGHMYINPKDIPFAVAMLWATHFLARLARQLPSPDWRNVVAFGLCAGAAMGLRIGGVLILAYLGAAFVLWFVAARGLAQAGAPAERRPGLRQVAAALSRLAAAFAIAYGVMLLAWPWALDAPLRRPLEALATFSRFPLDTEVLLNGQPLRSVSLPAYYLPLMIAVKLPLLHLLLPAVLLARLAAAWRALGASVRTGDQRWLPWAVTLVALLLPLGYALVTRPVLYNEMRHFLFLLPLLAVLGGVGAEALCCALARRGLPLRAALAGGLLGYLLLHVVMLARLHPYEYVAYNRLVGGLAGADQRFELDYWGTTQRALFAALKQRLREREGEAALRKPWRIRLCGAPEAGRYYLEPQWSAIWGDAEGQADFEVGRPGGVCNPPGPPATTLEIRREGVLLGYLNDRRGTAP